jgi:hypothetical protein
VHHPPLPLIRGPLLQRPNNALNPYAPFANYAARPIFRNEQCRPPLPKQITPKHHNTKVTYFTFLMSIYLTSIDISALKSVASVETRDGRGNGIHFMIALAAGFLNLSGVTSFIIFYY